MGLLLLSIGIATFFFLSQSSLLAIEQIEVEGNKAVSTEEVMLQAGHLLRGQSLLKPSFEDVSETLLRNPFVESVEVERDFPDKVRLVVREYRPFVNLSAAGNETIVVSAEGRALIKAESSVSTLPKLSTREPCAVEVGTTAECPDVLTGVRFLASVPMNFNLEFAEVMVSSGDITVKMKSGALVHFGSLEEYGLKFEVMRQLLARSVAAGASVSIDVSVPERPVTRDNTPPPAASPDETVPDDAAADEAPADEAVLDEDTQAAPAAEETLDAAPEEPAADPAGQAADGLGETGYAETE